MSCFQMELDAARFQVTFPDHSKPRVVITDESGTRLGEMIKNPVLTGWYRLVNRRGFGRPDWEYAGANLRDAAAAAVRAYQRENESEAVPV